MNCAWEIRTCKHFLIRRIIRKKSIKEIELPLHPSRCIWIKFDHESRYSNNQDSRNNEEWRRSPSKYWSLLMIPYCNSDPISISRWCSIEGTLEGIDTAKYALKLAPLEARSTLLPYDHPVRHIRDHANTEREVIAVPFALASLPTYPCGQIVRYLFVDTRIIWRINEIFSFHSLQANLLILLNRTFVVILIYSLIY